MSVLMLTDDLMFSSRVTGSARALGVAAGVVSSAEQLLARADSSADLKLVILDLTASNCELERIVPHLRKRESPPAVVAYAPHLRTALLDQARKSGCDQVLTRGQFDSRLNTLLADLA